MVTANDIWLGDWQAKILERVHLAGFDSVSALLKQNPNCAYFQVARILGPDVAAVQLGMMYFEEAKKKNAVRCAAKDALCRALHSNLKHGWNHGLHAKRMMAGAYSEWLAVLEFRALAPELSSVGEAVWNELNAANPPVGWLPMDVEDSILTAVFDKAWPITRHQKASRQSFGLFCPKCSAVLATPPDGVNWVTCPHCGEETELI